LLRRIGFGRYSMIHPGPPQKCNSPLENSNPTTAFPIRCDKIAG
jgi:hypothetical protein